MSESKETLYPALPVLPRHVGIIMDGNGRWARQRGLPRLAGHRAGVENLRRILHAAVELSVPIITLYAFSTENWQRPEDEVHGLLDLLSNALNKEVDELHKNGVQLRHIGDLTPLSQDLKRRIEQAIMLTRNNARLIANVAFNYGGRQEIIRALQGCLRDGLSADQITEEAISQHLDTAGQPDPDLIIRTSGELRVSNFMLWQGAYAEYYTSTVFWPDFDKAEFYKALVAFSQRSRRYGGLQSA